MWRPWRLPLPRWAAVLQQGRRLLAAVLAVGQQLRALRRRQLQQQTAAATAITMRNEAAVLFLRSFHVFPWLLRLCL